ncbi:hypothetical protein ACNPNM_04115 [Klebsiella variicola]|uniref:hypothetical protein n=1 Tax=Klebsiella pneumoniae complex TaxID=3390273 RepID=UPI000E2BB7A5|nr:MULTISPECIES: hypothetical protein [Klebsiella]HBQ5882021.1 hypothetical protein [Klebsiella pneumoniae subsp. pneumoniae]HCA9960780.1 hypothetical protein [Klebsiella quasipneumoniae subsp. quasipneumoniae]MCD6611853.1 hypothetical protein [Klebsiella quasipneumoniae subsp. similipneumoniae]MCP6656224.1 hypothetical protein [Klebsiella pneumoniae]VVJ59121.1 Uncharacterised protein [Klebsiella pneumoniae]
MNIETVNELITSLESAGELSIKERKYLDLAKAYVQLAAENVGLKVAIDGVHHELYGQGFMVAGWHLNGALEPLDTWFEDNNWNPETPVTSAYLAGIKVDGVRECAAWLLITASASPSWSPAPSP